MNELMYMIGELISMEIDEVDTVTYPKMDEVNCQFIVKLLNGSKYKMRIDKIS